ncbi:Putative integrase (plasmid) [Mesorhizobium loti]|nr:Putative integrase [Mesorhizobium loti]
MRSSAITPKSIPALACETPLSRLDYGLHEFGAPPRVANLKAYLIDFLPIVQRRLGRSGFQIDNITYYTPNLDRFIERREQTPQTYEIRRDPRNLRFIWAVLPGGEGYLEIPSWFWRRAPSYS